MMETSNSVARGGGLARRVKLWWRQVTLLSLFCGEVCGTKGVAVGHVLLQGLSGLVEGGAVFDLVVVLVEASEQNYDFEGLEVFVSIVGLQGNLLLCCSSSGPRLS